jgi:hypothetical protein
MNDSKVFEDDCKVFRVVLRASGWGDVIDLVIDDLEAILLKPYLRKPKFRRKRQERTWTRRLLWKGWKKEFYSRRRSKSQQKAFWRELEAFALGSWMRDPWAGRSQGRPGLRGGEEFLCWARNKSHFEDLKAKVEEIWPVVVDPHPWVDRRGISEIRSFVWIRYCPYESAKQRILEVLR